MITTNPIALIVVAAFLQSALVIGMRKHGLHFGYLVVPAVAMQWCFLRAFSSPEISFTVSWFIATGVLAIGALATGAFVFHEQLGWPQYLGVALVLAGVMSMRL